MQRVDLEREVGVVDENIHGGKFFSHRPRHLLHLFSLCHVRLKDHSLPALFFHLLEDR